MKRLIASAACALALCASAPAQQPALVEVKDDSDPCARFKMRVLMPAGLAGRKRRARGTAPSIDPAMVWNPCGGVELQLAATPEAAPPNTIEQFFRARAARLGLPADVKKSEPPRVKDKPAPPKTDPPRRTP